MVIMKALKYLSFVGKIAGLVFAFNVIPFVEPQVGVIVFAPASILRNAGNLKQAGGNKDDSALLSGRMTRRRTIRGVLAVLAVLARDTFGNRESGGVIQKGRRTRRYEGVVHLLSSVRWPFENRLEDMKE